LSDLFNYSDLFTKFYSLQVIASYIVDWTGKLHSLSTDISVADFILVFPICRGLWQFSYWRL